MIPRGRPTPSDTARSVPPDGRPLADQPKWRRDFPIDWAQDEHVSRRDLVKFLVLTSAAFTVGQAWIALQSLFSSADKLPADAVAIARVDDLPVGEGLTFAYPEGSGPRLLVRTDTNAFVAYEQQCTHLMCPVMPVFEERRLHCPCHNGWFDLETGAPIAGPPRRPLQRVLLQIRDGTVYAVGLAEPSA